MHFMQVERMTSEELAGKGGVEKMAGIFDSETGWLVATNHIMGVVLVPLLVVAFEAIREIIGRRRAVG
jgi:hypothetical protein